jgi:hypothetical protein
MMEFIKYVEPILSALSSLAAIAVFLWGLFTGGIKRIFSYREVEPIVLDTNDMNEVRAIGLIEETITEYEFVEENKVFSLTETGDKKKEIVWKKDNIEGTKRRIVFDDSVLGYNGADGNGYGTRGIKIIRKVLLKNRN